MTIHTPRGHASVGDHGRRSTRSRAQWSWPWAVPALLLAAGVPPLADDLPGACDAKESTNGKPFDITVGGEVNTDYPYRGITLSAWQPATRRP